MPYELPNIVCSTKCLKKVRNFNKTSEVPTKQKILTIGLKNFINFP